MAPKPATFLLLLAVPPYLRLLAIFIAALALFAALGSLLEFRSALRRWFGERPTVGKTDRTVRNPDMENGPTPQKDT
jgi:hypothetical protein